MKTMELTKAEVEALKDFCDDNLVSGSVRITQDALTTKVEVVDLPETLTDITDNMYV